jgi:hypothetical protein
MENAPRYCSITNEPMWEGWYFEGLDMYVKYEDEAKRICTDYDYATLHEAYEDGMMYWTEWYTEPESEWHEAPKVGRNAAKRLYQSKSFTYESR